MTHLVRVKKETFEALQKLSGRLQMKTGKRISLNATIQFLLQEKPTKHMKKEGGEKAAPQSEKEPLKWFSLHHRNFKEEKNTQSSTKDEPKNDQK